MANTKSAQKKVRKDIRKTSSNKIYLAKIDKVLASSRKGLIEAGSDALKAAYAVIDKAAKRRVISKQKASRLKSLVARA